MSNASFPSRTRDDVCEGRDRLPLAALLALAMTGFTAIMTETLPAGLLPQLAAGLEVSQAMAGQLVTSYAAGSLVAAIPLTALAQGWRRRPTLLAAIIGFLVFNTVTALSTSFALALGARFLAGIAAGLAWGILAGYARRMVAGPQQGRALAIAMVGTPLALSLGVPAGAFLGAAIGWRWAFLAMSGTTVALVAWVAVAVPDYPGQAGDRRQAVGSVFASPGVRPILAVVFAWMTAHNVLYTFVAPLAARAGLEGRVDLLLLGFGLSALAGIWLIGVLVDRILRVLVLASLALFAAATLLLGLGGTAPAALTGSVLAWGLSFGGAATLLQTAIGDAAGEGIDLANAMVTTVWNGAIASGGVIGGLLLHVGGADLLAWAAILFIAAAFLVATAARHRGFVPGPRTQA
jgi:predicted MFS family arabinose efflux permease